MGPIAGAAAAPAERKEGAAGCGGAAGVRRRLAGASAMSLLCVRGECVESGGRGAGVAEGSTHVSSGLGVTTFSRLHFPSVPRGAIMLTQL